MQLITPVKGQPIPDEFGGDRDISYIKTNDQLNGLTEDIKSVY